MHVHRRYMCARRTRSLQRSGTSSGGGGGGGAATTNPLPRENQVPVGGWDRPRFIIFYYTWGNVSSRGTTVDSLARFLRSDAKDGVPKSSLSAAPLDRFLSHLIAKTRFASKFRSDRHHFFANNVFDFSTIHVADTVYLWSSEISRGIRAARL